MISEEQGSGRGDQPITKFSKIFGVAGDETTTYFSIPFFVSSKNYFITVTKSDWHIPVVFDFTKSNEITVEFYSNHGGLDVGTPIDSIDLFLHRAASQRESLVNSPTLPEWSYGTILGLQGGEDKVNRILDSCLALGNPVTAVWIQDWCGRRKTRLGSQLRWDWEVDSALYPNFKSWTGTLQKKGVVVLGYINPFLSVGTPMFDFAKANHFLLEDKKGNVLIQKTGGFDAGLVNLYKSQSQQWLLGVMKNMVDSGMHGWMADFGEWAPINLGFENEDPISTLYAKETHNNYVIQWAKLNSEMRNYDTSFACFMRAGTIESPMYQSLYWMGDQTVNWGEQDGIKSTVTAINSAGMSGIPNLHSDIGGYTTIDNVFLKLKRDKELFMRWAELNIFQSFYRTHEGLRPASNHQFYSDDSTMSFFAKMGKLHFYFKEYIQVYQKKNSLPLLHPMLLHYPNDSNCYNLKTQFMFGEDIMVAPVLEKGATSVPVYFPKGNWEHVLTHQFYQGPGYFSVQAPLGIIPFFIKEKSDWKNYFDKVPK
jgi:alpha-glucosidase